MTDVTINNVSLISSIGPFPDGGSYSVTYEKTPQNDTYTTGRISKVTLPSGGTIEYKYDQTNDGVNCADGSTMKVTRTVTPGGDWAYARTQVAGSHWQTEVTTPPDLANSDSASDVTFIDFQDSGGSFYETQRQVNQGTSTLLGTAYRCYNGNSLADPTQCATTAVTLPITEVDSFWQPAEVRSRLGTQFDSTYGRVTVQSEFDSSGTAVRTTLFTYANPGNNIFDRPACVQTTSGTTPPTCTTPSSSTVSATKYDNYDAFGNVGTVSRWVSGVASPKWLSQGLSSYSHGLPQTITDVNTTPTTITYGACNGAFPTQVSQPLGLSRSADWNCNGGVP